MLTSSYLPPFRALLPSTLVLFAGAAFAQAPADTETPKPAPLATLQYASPIGAYTNTFNYVRGVGISCAASAPSRSPNASSI